MIITKEIKSFLSGVNDVSLGYNEINFFSASTLEEEQTGYCINSDGNSLINNKPGSWKDGWVAIATDNMGDPVFVDCNNKDMPVYTAEHGKGEWNAVLLARSLNSFKTIIRELEKLSAGRQTPVEIEDNPVHEKEIACFLKNVTHDNRKGGIDYWEAFLDC